ncbi:Eukaryotic translation initiation factor eIF2A [Aspergillus parasiticus SU-1]|uniref:Eukaryotic translation initiation factor 2A n=2 Tax=Aspergillus parasiticus TaxID=5067 RepID=A0A5N6DQM4_ASPPA|nr:eukaryotic translation initiation factor eIF2A-domain-containing protein [Aspergillus parasiticus]KJK67706.1 Eukaryotic translation initiation factor eIF2A [Aspergillus parasiticus SU-1]
MAAPTQLAFRTVKGIGILDAAPVYEPLSGFERPEGNLRCSAYSPCGRYFAWASPEKVTVIDSSVGHIITNIPAENVFELGFSPLGTYLITWQRPSKDANGDAVKNLKVWKIVETAPDSNGDEHTIVGSYVQKSQTGWNLQYTSDERYCARVVTNEVQFYQSDNLSKVWNKLRVEGVIDFAVSPGKSQSVAVFVPERKGQPAAVKVFMVPQFGAPVSQKTFFKGDKVQLKWNASGTTLLVLAQTDVDRSGKSYYGETTLYLLGATGGFDSRVDLDKEGPIHDVTWSPNSREFGVVYGYMPAKTTIFNFRGVPQHSFPLAPRNTISFSPHGRFVLVAGFGNLAGQMDIYDLEKNYFKIATVEASNASVCEWSPDGKYILTATTSPRLRVDNGVRLWHVSGALVYNEEMNELYDVFWRPQSTTQHPLGDPFHPLPTPHPSAVAYLSTRKAPVKPAGAYRPPGARGQLTPLAFKREDQGGATFIRDGTNGGALNGLGKPRRREIPGADPVEEYLPPGAAPGGGVVLPPGADQPEKLSKSAARNKKKREAKKLKDGEDGQPARSPESHGDKGHHERSRSKANNSERKNANQANGASPASTKPNNNAAAEAAGTPTAQEKKIRGLLKKIRAIDELKMRLAGGEKLEDTQLKKIQTEESVRKELESLGFNG